VKSKLCIDARFLFSSGIGTYLRGLIPHLQEAFSITLLLQKGEGHRIPSSFSVEHIEVDIPIFSWKERLLFKGKIPSCDLFWVPHYNLPCVSKKKEKWIVTLHDVCPLAMPEGFSWYKKSVARILLRQAIEKADLLLTVSSFSSQEIQKYFPFSKTTPRVVPNGVTPKPACTCTCWNKRAPFFLYVGNLKPHKNLERLLRVAQRLPEPFSLILVGKSFMPLSWPDKTRITWLGEVEEEILAFLYAKAFALVHPSLYEGFGLTPLEAMQMGCPVIASAIPSVQEVCAEAILYIDPSNETSLYQGMMQLIENPSLREKFVAAGYERVRIFSWKRSGEKIKTLFQELLT